MLSYGEFIEHKAQLGDDAGFDPLWVPEFLYDFQAALLEWSLRKGKAAIFADCGTGKTPIQLAWAENVCRHTDKPVLILTPLAVSQQTVREAEKFGIDCQASREGKVMPRVTVTNYERLHYFDASAFGGVVLDECFPPDAKIDVFNIDKVSTLKYIKDIQPGDRVLNTYGADHVKRTHKRQINRAIRISTARGDITCSENHPFFTLHGWRCAQDLQPGDLLMETDAAMRLVRSGVHPAIPSNEDAAFLRSVLLSEMADEHSRTQGEGSQSSSSSKARGFGFQMVARRESGSKETDRANHRAQSNERPEGEGQGICYIAENGAQAFRAWWEWSRPDCSSTSFAGRAGSDVDSRVCLVAGPQNYGVSYPLQARLGERRQENSHRSGRQLSLRPEASRREEGCQAGFSRVDCVEILEQGHPGLERYRDGDGHVYFYDLEVAQHPSFSVNGLLVHNSSAIKHFTGARQRAITQFMARVPYRLLCTATAAPNDYIELGTSSEALGQLGYMDMLGMFFVNEENTLHRTWGIHLNWRFKKHAEQRFWRWVSSWARAMRRPSDLGFDDARFILPPLTVKETVLSTDYKPPGELFHSPARTLDEQRAERKATIQERCERTAAMVNHSAACVVWCHINAEADALVRMIPGAEQVKGSDDDDDKEARLVAFSQGNLRVLVTKPKIGAWGLNWQHCAHMTMFPSHSYEQYYQAIRRCWRYGQTRPVQVDIISSEGEAGVVQNMKRKEQMADTMFSSLVAEMNSAVKIKRATAATITEEVPSWL